MWLQLMVGLVLGGTAVAVQCPGGHRCESPYTCCLRSQQDGYACCTQSQLLGAPLPGLPPSAVNGASSVLCLDGRVCPGRHSCLRTVDASLGCCPWEKAISCADGHHCCPLGSHCSVDGKSCFQHEVLTGATVIGAVPCPDGESECPNDSTCCLMPDGAWGCCPMPEAACCADKIHCCPHGTTCDLPHARCYAPSGTLPLLKKFPAIKQALSMELGSLLLSSVSAAIKAEGPLEGNICKQNSSACPDSATCCLLPMGQHGCCPLQNAVCCGDHLHCCPQGTQCDLEHSRCTMTSRWSRPLTHLLLDFQRAADVQCDAQYKCPDGNTCCPLGSSSWGCCPLVEAVCCADGTHCCPKGYTCLPSEGSCQKESKSIAWLLKVDPPLPADSREATCCQDGHHCCPSGYHCDRSQGGCVKDGESVPWLEKSPALLSLSRDVKCDEEFSCPDLQTCCQMKSGIWACCPFSEATCCQDGLHCCPSGYRCDLSQGSCVKGRESLPWLEKKLAVVSLSKDIKCDDEFSCPEGQTCCRMKSGVWACCPFSEGVCCLNKAHCCPYGYFCDPVQGTCKDSHPSLSWAPKHPASAPQDRVIRCNATASCEEGQTCCKGVAGDWDCCQLPNAVCCEDHQHCCPSGYTCNVAAQTCEKQREAWPLPSGELLAPSLVASGRDVSCDPQHYCHDRQTCCKASSGGWACCPYDKGSCCSDRRHCCPPGFRCSRSGFECIKQKPLQWATDVPPPGSAQEHGRPLL